MKITIKGNNREVTIEALEYKPSVSAEIYQLVERLIKGFNTIEIDNQQYVRLKEQTCHCDYCTDNNIETEPKGSIEQ